MSRAIRRVLVCVAATTLAAYAAGGLLLWLFPDRFLHFPEPETRRNPGMEGLRYVDVWLRVGPQREWVHGWFLPHERNAPAVLLLHGTGRTIAGMVHVAAAIHAAGAAVLMIDYRGLGKSSRGPLTEARMYEDAEAAWHELRWHQPDPGLRLVYGHSLGGAIALELAARYPDANGVVVEAAPTSIAALLRESWVARIYPVDAILAGRFDAAAKIPRVGAPILFIHGKRDPIVPTAMGVELYLRATGRKRLLLVDRAAHSDAAIVGATEYQAAFERMLPPLREPALAGATPRAAPSRAGGRRRRASRRRGAAAPRSAGRRSAGRPAGPTPTGRRARSPQAARPATRGTSARPSRYRSRASARRSRADSSARPGTAAPGRSA
jgi:hypothetical protein